MTTKPLEASTPCVLFGESIFIPSKWAYRIGHRFWFVFSFLPSSSHGANHVWQHFSSSFAPPVANPSATTSHSCMIAGYQSGRFRRQDKYFLWDLTLHLQIVCPFPFAPILCHVPLVPTFPHPLSAFTGLFTYFFFSFLPSFSFPTLIFSALSEPSAQPAPNKLYPLLTSITFVALKEEKKSAVWKMIIYRRCTNALLWKICCRCSAIPTHVT